MLANLKSKFRAWLVNSVGFTKNIFLPGFEGLSLYETGVYLGTGLKKNSIVDRSYAISYKFLIASFPLVIFLFSIIPYIPVDGLQDLILKSILEALPDQLNDYMSLFLEDLLLHKKTAILSIGFLLTIFFASNTMTAILKGFSSSYHLNRMKQKAITIRLWSIGLMFIFGTILVLAALVFILGGILLDYWQDHDFIRSSVEIWLVWFLEWVVILFLFMMAVSILYNVGNAEKEKWKLFSPGVIFSTIMIWIFSQAFSFFVAYVAPFNKLYGSLGTIIVLLLFVYYFFAILLIGFELNLSIQSGKHKKRAQATIS